MEQDLIIREAGQYKNLDFKPNLKKGYKGLDNGNHIVITKNNFAEGMEKEGQYGKFYVCQVEYKGEDVGFILNEKEHTLYKDCGGVGDKLTVTLNKVEYLNPVTNIQMLLNKLAFKLVE